MKPILPFKSKKIIRYIILGLLLLFSIFLSIVATKTNIRLFPRADEEESLQENEKETIPLDISQTGTITGTISIDKEVIDSFDLTRSLVVSWCEVNIVRVCPGGSVCTNKIDLDCPRSNWITIPLSEKSTTYSYKIDNVPLGRKGITLLSYYFLSNEDDEGILLPNNPLITTLDCQDNSLHYSQDCTVEINNNKVITQNFLVSKRIEPSPIQVSFQSQFLCSLGTLALFKSNNIIINDQLRALEEEFRLKSLNTFQTDKEIGLNNIKLKKNQDYQNPLILIQKAVEEYEKKTGRKVYYQLQRQQKYDYAIPIYSACQKMVQRSQQAEIDSITTEIVKQVGKKEGIALFLAHHNLLSFNMYPIPGSGLYQKVVRALKEKGELAGSDLENIINIENDNIVVNTYSSRVEDESIKEFIDQAKNNILYEAGPADTLSTSKIIEYFLREKNDGDLSASIWDTAILLKAISRNDQNGNHIGTSYNARTTENAIFVSSLIKDEYGRSNNFNELQKIIHDINNNAINKENRDRFYFSPNPELSLINQIGKPYHVINMIALLQYFPPEFIKALVVGEGLFGVQKQGYSKTEADFAVALVLEKIDDYFTKFIKNK